jgi:hypothetical protein
MTPDASAIGRAWSGQAPPRRRRSGLVRVRGRPPRPANASGGLGASRRASRGRRSAGDLRGASLRGFVVDDRHDAASDQFVKVGYDDAIVGGEVGDVEADASHPPAQALLAVAVSRLLLADQPTKLLDVRAREARVSLHGHWNVVGQLS